MKGSRIGKLEKQEDGSLKWRPLTSSEREALSSAYEAWLEVARPKLKASRTVH